MGIDTNISKSIPLTKILSMPNFVNVDNIYIIINLNKLCTIPNIVYSPLILLALIKLNKIIELLWVPKNRAPVMINLDNSPGILLFRTFNTEPTRIILIKVITMEHKNKVE